MKMWKWVIELAIGAFLLLMLCLTLPKIIGIQAYAVTSGSMEPKIPTGSMVYVTRKRFEEIRPGDILTFRVSGGTMTVTHRVREKSESDRSFLTQGDANAYPDAKRIPYKDVCGTVCLCVPGMGYAAAMFGNVWGKLLAALLFLWLLTMEMIVSECRRIQKREGVTGI